MNEIDKKVAEYLETLGVSVQVVFLYSVPAPEWPHDKWKIIFNRFPKPIQDFEYSTGIGHRIDCTIRNQRGLPTGTSISSSKKIKKIRELREAAKELKLKGDTVVTLEQSPLITTGLVTQAEVLYSVISDIDCALETFQDFCDNMGLNEDSIKDRETYFACQKNGTKLRSIFSGSEVEHLRELLQDY